MFTIKTVEDAVHLAELQQYVIDEAPYTGSGGGVINYTVFQVPVFAFAKDLPEILAAFLGEECSDVIIYRTKAPALTTPRERLTLPFLLPTKMIHDAEDMFVCSNIMGMESSQIVMQPHYKDQIVCLCRSAHKMKQYDPEKAGLSKISIPIKGQELVQTFCWHFLRSRMTDMPYAVHSNQSKLTTFFNRRSWRKLVVGLNSNV